MYDLEYNKNNCFNTKKSIMNMNYCLTLKKSLREIETSQIIKLVCRMAKLLKTHTCLPTRQAPII